jgi:hypothetical protein
MSVYNRIGINFPKGKVLKRYVTEGIVPVVASQLLCWSQLSIYTAFSFSRTIFVLLTGGYKTVPSDSSVKNTNEAQKICWCRRIVMNGIILRKQNRMSGFVPKLQTRGGNPNHPTPY